MRRTVSGLLLLAMMQAGLAWAQTYPAKPLQLVVPFSAGNAINDTVARLVAPKLAEQIGQPVVVNNRPGANGVIGSEQVARAAPDGKDSRPGPTGAAS